MENVPSFKYTLPTWSKLELRFVVSDIELWYFGGVARYVLRLDDKCPRLELNRPLDQELFSSTIAESFCKSSFGTLHLLDSYMLVHAISPVTEDGGYEYDGEIVYSFASDIIFNCWCRSMENRCLLERTVSLIVELPHRRVISCLRAIYSRRSACGWCPWMGCNASSLNPLEVLMMSSAK